MKYKKYNYINNYEIKKNKKSKIKIYKKHINDHNDKFKLIWNH